MYVLGYFCGFSGNEVREFWLKLNRNLYILFEIFYLIKTYIIVIYQDGKFMVQCIDKRVFFYFFLSFILQLVITQKVVEYCDIHLIFVWIFFPQCP